MKKIVLLSLAVGMLLASCQNNAKNKSYEGYDRTSNGLYYKFYEQNGGDNPQEMEILDVFMSCTINDTSIIIPKNRMIIQMMESMFVGDIFEGIKMMHIGDSASFLVRADSTFYTLFQSPVLPNEFNVDDMMKFEIRLNDFYPESEFAAKQIEYMKNNFPEETLMSENELNKYFKDNNIKPITTASGLNYVVTKEGNGEKPQIGTIVAIGDGENMDNDKNKMKVKIGDRVVFSKYAGVELKLDGENYIVMRQLDVIGVVYDREDY